jgi:hypothetical protein
VTGGAVVVVVVADYVSVISVAIVTEAKIEWIIFLPNLVLVPPKQ